MITRLLLIDNYDSFTYNLFQYFGELGVQTQVVRNDELSVDEVGERGLPIVLSPGPCTPNEAGICLEVIARYAGTLPILGVCLGHQAIGQAFGGRVVRAARVMHGKVSPILHAAAGLFANIPSPMEATRYHSLLVERATLPNDLRVTAETEAGEIMAFEHVRHPVWGVQFHPESILTVHGKALLANFLQLAGSRSECG